MSNIHLRNFKNSDFSKTSGLVLFFFILLTIVSCGKKLEEAPIKDGYYLAYKYILFSPMTSTAVTMDVSFTNADEKHLAMKIAVIDTSKGPMHLSPGAVGTVIVDKYFKTARGDFYDMDPPGIVWIPSNLRKKGTKIQGKKIRQITQWAHRVACDLSEGPAMSMMHWYYDTTTGFLVGSNMEYMGAGVTAYLIETNIPGLMQTEE